MEPARATARQNSQSNQQEPGKSALSSSKDDKPPQPRRDQLPAHAVQPDSGPTLTVERSTDVRQWIDEEWLTARLDEAAPHIHHPIARVTFYLVDDDYIAKVHKRTHGSSDTTDVITMPLSDPGKPIEADVILCVDEAFRRAEELGHTAEQELLLYALHGLLHCAGLDDRDDASFKAMHAEEDRILEAIGVGRTFDRRI